MTETTKLPYRPCVGIMLLNRDGLVWIGRRLPKWTGDSSAHVWQMPQGGIDQGEDPRVAAKRELAEETGVRTVDVVAQTDDWLHYDLPPELLGMALKGKYCGQAQKWFVMRFRGSDDEIDIVPKAGHQQEFDAWRWARIEELPSLIVPFKRPIYDALVSRFARLAVPSP